MMMMKNKITKKRGEKKYCDAKARATPKTNNDEKL